MEQQIFIVSLKGTRKYFAKRTLISTISGKEINDFYAVFVRCYSKKGIPKKTYICTEEEMKKIKHNDKSIPAEFSPKLYDYVDIISLNVCLIVPSQAYLYVESMPELRTARNNTDTFSGADNQLAGETVQDNTRYSNRLAFKNGSDYNNLEHRDQALLEKDHALLEVPADPLGFLKELQAAGENAAIENKKTNLLEDKNDV